MKTSGLTEKNMSNQRFRKTERAIFIAYCKVEDYQNARKIAKYANISRSTLYYHHKKAKNIPVDYEDFLMQVYQKSIQNYLYQKDTSLRVIFFRSLIFIASNRVVFKALFRDNRKEIVKKILNSLKNRILIEWKMTQVSSKFYLVYENEILGIIEIWSKQNFSNKALNSALDDILYLTATARRQLLPLQ